MTDERKRLDEDRYRKAHWKRWGPYLSERQWGTVREDYSPDGAAWDYFTHDQARFRAYRWGEDGIAGISDNHQRLCFAIALWNGNDPIIKERLFGLTGSEGNHGEDVKEYYFYLDNTPTHSYMKYLYKYPQNTFPYSELVNENKRRTRREFEFELIDTGVFDDDRYFDVFTEYAKGDPDDILIRITVVNRGHRDASLHLLPTIWFRNTWSWNGDVEKPYLKEIRGEGGQPLIEAAHHTLGKMWLYFENPDEILFTENETNYERLFGIKNSSRYFKSGIDEYIVHNNKDAVNPDKIGTKATPNYRLKIGAKEKRTVRLRISHKNFLVDPLGDRFESIFKNRLREADEFYRQMSPFPLSDELRSIQRQALAGMLWNKQFYNYVVEDWLKGDSAMPPPPVGRENGRNHDWIHLYNDDILSVPDKWEYPWFASWDLAFHAIPLAMVDPEFAKRQLLLLTREWYMHPNGQLPAYEWAFGDVNPPVHAWSALRVYKIERKLYGREDRLFLERVFQKLLLNFTWWVNRKDSEGKNVFEGGFLGLDNIGVFDRSAKLPTGGHIEQADGTSWMGMYCLNMLAIALELARHNPSYEDIASKFFEHFLYIANAMNLLGEGTGLWDEEDGFYYDVLHLPDGRHLPMKVRSVVGLIPLFAIQTLEPDTLEILPGFKKRLEWFIDNREELKKNVACMTTTGALERRHLSIVNQDKLRRILDRMLDQNEFLGPHGIRAVSRFHASNPYIFHQNGEQYRIDYEPAESSSGLFGGNSNWRGPVWFPLNFLLIESLQKFHHYLGDGFKVECPKGSGKEMTLWEVADELSRRLISTFAEDPSGKRPVYGGIDSFQNDPHWHDYILFHEYFHGDSGAGIGANHQTGWTGLVAKLIQQCGEYSVQGKTPRLIEKAQRGKKPRMKKVTKDKKEQ